MANIDHPHDGSGKSTGEGSGQSFGKSPRSIASYRSRPCDSRSWAMTFAASSSRPGAPRAILLLYGRFCDILGHFRIFYYFDHNASTI
jgi:hypothetical protein